MTEYLLKRVSLALVGLSAVAFCFLTLPYSFADDVIVDQVNVTVPVACSLNDSTGGTGKTYTASMMPGQYKNDIGSTTIVATCNDSSGFAIYAIGYSNEEYGNTDLITNLANPGASGTNTGSIVTGTATSGPTSNWAMKLSTQTSPTPAYPIVIQNSLDSFSAVPNDYTLVAKRTSNTDVGVGAEGARLNTHYAVYVSPTQVAATYTGKVLYRLVHPNDAPAPVPVSKNLYYAITGSANNYTLTISDSDITAGAVVSGPVAINGYSSYSSVPWYSYRTGIKSVEVDGAVVPTSTAYWFYELKNCDSWDLSGLRTDHVTSMASMFHEAGYNATTFTLDLSGWNTASVTNISDIFFSAGYSATTWSVGDLSGWNTASVTNMSNMFQNAGYSATTWSVGDLSGWNTASVTSMQSMFNSAGYSATTWSVGDLSGWNTASVTNISTMFRYAGRNATTFTLDLSGWNTASVTNMSQMFQFAGYSATFFTLDLSGWNTASVTNISDMFYLAGRSATTWSVTIPKTNNGTGTGPIANTTSKLYGSTTSKYATPPSGKSFTLAN